MKKFSQSITAVHEAETAAKSELQKSYQEYFTAKLNKFGVKSPAELDDAKKSEFFTEISNDWERGKGATKAGQADVEAHGVKESAESVAESMGDFAKHMIKILGSTNKAESWMDKNGYLLAKIDMNKIKDLDDAKEVYTAINNHKGDINTFTFVKESAVNEGVIKEEDVKSEADFKEYAMAVLKKAHPDDFDEAKANETIDGILKKCGDDYGAAVGMLQASLSEGETCPMCKQDPCECYKEKDTNESVNPLNEAELYITDSNITDEATLKADILKNIGPAFNQMLKNAGIKYNPVTASESRGRIQFESKPLTGDALGIFKYGIRECWIGLFSGGNMPQIQKDTEKFSFKPYIWATLNYSYKHGAQGANYSSGSNGCSLYLPGEDSDSIYYDIVGKKFLTNSQAMKRKDWQ